MKLLATMNSNDFTAYPEKWTFSDNRVDLGAEIQVILNCMDYNKGMRGKTIPVLKYKYFKQQHFQRIGAYIINV